MPGSVRWRIAGLVTLYALLTGWGDHVATEAPPGVHVDRLLTKPVPRRAILALIAELAGPQ
jgi:hypothetical protein